MENKKLNPADLSLDSLAVHGNMGHDSHVHAVSFPIYQTSTYINTNFGHDIDFSYSRCANPTRDELEKTVALLEGAKYGFAFSSGLAAETALFSTLSQGDHVVIGDDIYGGTYRLTQILFAKLGVEFTVVDFSYPERVEAAIKPNTKMLYVETPTNPMMKVCDIRAIAAISKKCGALFVVDNTFMTPVFQKPLELGADVVIHSGTKYLSGHHDTMAGFLITSNEELYQKVVFTRNTEGAALAPFDAWLVLRGIKTLTLRMRKHEENAIAVAKWLEKNKNVDKVFFVGLDSHPAKKIVDSQCSGYGGMLSFTLKDTSMVRSALCDYKMIMFAESLGGVQTLITYPLTQTHGSIPKEIRDSIGITENLIRLSVGIEDANDIIKDLASVLGEN